MQYDYRKNPGIKYGESTNLGKIRIYLFINLYIKRGQLSTGRLQLLYPIIKGKQKNFKLNQTGLSKS